MYYVEIVIKDEQGNVVVPPQKGPAVQPILWKSPPGHPLLIEREPNDQGVSNGCYELWHFSYNPSAQLRLGWRKPFQK